MPLKLSLAFAIIFTLNVSLTYFFLRNRIRACVNILGDAFGAGIIEALSRKELDKLAIDDGSKESLNASSVDERL